MNKHEILSKQLKLLSYVINHGVVKGHELSYIIGVSERQIFKYVKDLRQAGFDIQSKTGSNGGYYYNVSKCPLCCSEINKVDCK